MAGAIVHEKFFGDCIKNSSLNLNNNCSIYVQGHDLLLYIEPWNFSVNRQISLCLSNYKFQKFVYNYLNAAIRNDTMYLSKDVKLFIYGFISHHILDAYFHPFIMQYCQDYLPVKNKLWLHGIIETLYDSFFIKKYYNYNPEKFKFYKKFEYKNTKNSYLIENINSSGLNTYNIKMLGRKFNKAFYSIKSYMHLYRYDPKNIKKSLGKIYDKISYIGAEYFFTAITI